MSWCKSISKIFFVDGVIIWYFKSKCSSLLREAILCCSASSLRDSFFNLLNLLYGGCDDVEVEVEVEVAVVVVGFHLILLSDGEN